MKVLVLGYGLLGSEIVKQTDWNYISRNTHAFDFCDIESYKYYLQEYDTIVNCIADTNTYSDNRDNHRTINYKAVMNLSDYLSKQNKKLVHISTDYVYKNSTENASEDTLPLISENWYTYYKLMADEYIQSRNTNYLICRCSFKQNPFPYETAWSNPIGNFDYVDVISNLIIKAIKSNYIGLVNIGTEKKSIFDLAKKTNDRVRIVTAPKHVPADVSMSTSLLYKKILNEK